MSRSLAVSLLAAALLTAGCANDFAPQSDLLGLRVLALVADPLEIAPGQTVTIQPRNYVPPGSVVGEQKWTFCPISAGAVAAYACAVPQCEVDVPVSPDGSVTWNPTTKLLECLKIINPDLPPGVLPPSVADQLLTVFRYRITTDRDGTREAVLQIPQWTRSAPPDPNLPPVILGVEIGGQRAQVGVPTPPLPVGGILPVRLLIDPASVQTFIDAAGVTQSETMTGYFYTTAGTFSAGITTGTDTTSNLEGTGLLPGQSTAEVWVVALDLRGGQEVAGPFTVPLGP
jgi:hypothetical protein